jgi:hypothetical protein
MAEPEKPLVAEPPTQSSQPDAATDPGVRIIDGVSSSFILPTTLFASLGPFPDCQQRPGYAGGMIVRAGSFSRT